MHTYFIHVKHALACDSMCMRMRACSHAHILAGVPACVHIMLACHACKAKPPHQLSGSGSSHTYIHIYIYICVYRYIMYIDTHKY